MAWHPIVFLQFEINSLVGLTLGIVALLRYVPVCSKAFHRQRFVCLLLILCWHGIRAFHYLTESAALDAVKLLYMYLTSKGHLLLSTQKRSSPKLS